MSIIDENLTEDNNDLLTLKISADAGQELLKIGLEVKFFRIFPCLKRLYFLQIFTKKSSHCSPMVILAMSPCKENMVNLFSIFELLKLKEGLKCVKESVKM